MRMILIAMALAACSSNAQPAIQGGSGSASAASVHEPKAVASPDAGTAIPISADDTIKFLRNTTKGVDDFGEFMTEQWKPGALGLIFSVKDSVSADGAKDFAVGIVKSEIDLLIHMQYNPRVERTYVSLSVVRSSKTVTNGMKLTGIGDAVYRPDVDDVVWTAVKKK